MSLSTRAETGLLHVVLIAVSSCSQRAGTKVEEQKKAEGSSSSDDDSDDEVLAPVPRILARRVRLRQFTRSASISSPHVYLVRCVLCRTRRPPAKRPSLSRRALRAPRRRPPPLRSRTAMTTRGLRSARARVGWPLFDGCVASVTHVDETNAQLRPKLRAFDNTSFNLARLRSQRASTGQAAAQGSLAHSHSAQSELPHGHGVLVADVNGALRADGQTCKHKDQHT